MKNTALALLATALPLVAVAGCATHTRETVATAPPPAVITTTPGGTVTTAPGTVVTTPGSNTSVVVASPATSGTTRMVGRVDEVDSSGRIKVKTTDGRTLKLRVPAATAAGVHEGDTATVDVTFTR